MHFDELNISSGKSEKLFSSQRSERNPKLKSPEDGKKHLFLKILSKVKKNGQKLKPKKFFLECKKLRGLNLIDKK